LWCVADLAQTVMDCVGWDIVTCVQVSTV
jgi:hypothetical protein